MDKQETGRNRPTEKGEDRDPNLRDDSAVQPGISTTSSSDTDDDNENVTKTAADGFRTEDDDDPHADQAFDDMDEK
jgi:hypothetical protein